MFFRQMFFLFYFIFSKLKESDYLNWLLNLKSVTGVVNFIYSED